jgi:hypothetical protein
MNEREEVARELFEPSGNGAVPLEIVKEGLHTKAVRVAAPVEPQLVSPIGMRMDHGFHPLELQLLSNCVRVVGSISD